MFIHAHAEMETKRFFSFLKRWKRLDSSWSMELASLDVHFRGSGKAKLLEEAMGKESEAEKDWKAMRQKDGTIPLAWKVYRDRTVALLLSDYIIFIYFTLSLVALWAIKGKT